MRADIVALVPLNEGQRKAGVDTGPDALTSQLSAELASRDVFTVDKPEDGAIHAEETAPSDGPLMPASVGAINKRLHEGIVSRGRAAIAAGRLPHTLTLGGDHSLGIGSVSASAVLAAECVGRPDTPWKRPELVLFWIDAHTDIHTPGTTASGNLHGCPVSLLAGIGTEAWAALDGHFAWALDAGAAHVGGRFVSPAKIVYIAVRDIDGPEEEIVARENIRAYRMSDVEKRSRDVRAIVAEALAAVDPSGEHAIHCSFDIDGLDPAEAPATGTPVPGGLHLAEGIAIVEALRDTGRLMALDMVEVNPSLACDKADLAKTLDSAAAIIRVFTQ